MKKLHSYMLVLSFVTIQSCVLQGMHVVKAAKHRPMKVQSRRPVSTTISKQDIPKRITKRSGGKDVEILPTLPPQNRLQEFFGIRPFNPVITPRKITRPISPTVSQNWLEKLLGTQRPNHEYFKILMAIEVKEKGYSFSQNTPKLLFYMLMKDKEHNFRTIIEYVSPTLTQSRLQKLLGIPRHNPAYYDRLKELEKE